MFNQGELPHGLCPSVASSSLFLTCHGPSNSRTSHRPWRWWASRSTHEAVVSYQPDENRGAAGTWSRTGPSTWYGCLDNHKGKPRLPATKKKSGGLGTRPSLSWAINRSMRTEGLRSAQAMHSTQQPRGLKQELHDPLYSRPWTHQQHTCRCTDYDRLHTEHAARPLLHSSCWYRTVVRRKINIVETSQQQTNNHPHSNPLSSLTPSALGRPV